MTKYTEYEILVFLKYEEVFNSLASKTLTPQTSRLNNLSSGISVTRFHPALANLERIMDLYSICSKL